MPGQELGIGVTRGLTAVDRDSLRKELVALRRGTSVTVDSLVGKDAILEALGVGTPEEAYEALRGHIARGVERSLDSRGVQFWRALRAVYGWDEDATGATATARRQQIGSVLHVEEKSVIRYEDQAIELLVAILVDGEMATSDETTVMLIMDGTTDWSYLSASFLAEWSLADNLLELLAVHRLPGRLLMRRDPSEQAVIMRLSRLNVPNRVTGLGWGISDEQFKLRLSWGLVKQAPYLHVVIDGHDQAITPDLGVEANLRLPLELQEDWEWLGIDWWWHGQREQVDLPMSMEHAIDLGLREALLGG